MYSEALEQEITLLRQENALLKQQLAVSNQELHTTINQLTRELKESQHFLQSVLNSLPQGIFWKDKNSRFLGCNQRLLQDVGFASPQDIIGKNDFELPWHQFAEVYRQDDEAVMSSNIPKLDYEEPQSREDGTQIWLKMSKLPLRNADGEVIGVFGFYEDITDRKIAKAALNQQEAQYRSIFETVSDGISVMDLDTGKIVAINPAFCQMHGYSQEEIFGLSPTDYIHPDSLGLFEEFVKIVKASGEFHGEAIDIRKDGTYFDIEVTGKLFNYNGKPHVLSVLRDISERQAAQRDRQQMEAQLRQQAQDLEQTLQELKHTQSHMIQAEKMSSLGQLVAGVAHEINNPVNFIHGNLSHLEEHIYDLLQIIHLYQQQNLVPDTELQDLLAEIDLEYIQDDLPKILNSMKIGTQRIRQIVLSLRTFSRMDEAEFKAVNIHEGIDSTLMILQHRLKEQPERPVIQVIKNYGTLPLVECYAGQLNQVFMNIIANAIDALEESIAKNSRLLSTPQISICTEILDNNFVAICIADNGMGIPEEIQQKIFNPFFTTKPIGKGTGMGMSISYQIITEKHGGKLECCSTPGIGTEFRIEIPVRHQLSSNRGVGVEVTSN